jgi:hypothetical protein
MAEDINMKKLHRLIIFFIIGFFLSGTGFAQDINFEFRDSSAAVNTYIDIPVKVTTTLTGRGVYSYSLQFSFSPTILSAQGVVITGAISAAFGTPAVNISQPGIITVAAAGSNALTGLGNFIFLRFKILAAGTTTLANTGANDNYLNEGNPGLVYLNNCLVTGIAPPLINIDPATAIILKGETQQFTATGGSAPYIWNSLNPIVAGISASGLLSAIQIGFTNVKATDANNYIGLSGAVEIRGYRLTIPDTTGTYNGYFDLPVRTTNLTGLNVLSGTFEISYTPQLLSDIQILTSNSLLQTVSPPVVNLNSPGLIAVSFAGSSYLSGAGVLFWIRCKLSNISGGNSPLVFQSAILNQDLVPITQNGSIGYLAPPALNISPNTGQLVYGDSLLLTATGTSPVPPFTWSVSDTNKAVINAAGRLKAKRSGQISVYVLDANASSGSSGIFQLYDTYLKIADTTGIAGAQVEIPVRIKALPTGQGILSAEGRIISSNPTLFTITDIVTAGTATAAFSVSTATGSNYIQFAMAGVTPVPGNTVLFKIKGVLSPTVQTGSQSSLSFQDILLNEGIPLPFVQNGSITEIPAPVIYTFIGNGNWDIPSNWFNNAIPPDNLTGNDEIVIDPIPGGECVLNIFQRLSAGTKITIKAGKKLRIPGNLTINQ